MLRNLVIIIFVLLAGFAAYVAMKPGEFNITRSASFKAPVEAVFAHINNFDKWQKWSPWYEMEPSQKMSYEGPIEGEGATMSWEGKETGIGTMKIVSSVPGQEIKMQLDFKKPMEATNAATFTFAAENGETKVTWSMTGVNGFIGKAFDVIMNMEKCVGEQFEKGFANLKKIVEGQ